MLMPITSNPLLFCFLFAGNMVMTQAGEAFARILEDLYPAGLPLSPGHLDSRATDIAKRLVVYSSVLVFLGLSSICMINWEFATWMPVWKVLSILSFLYAIKKLWFNITNRTSPEQTEKIDTDWDWDWRRKSIRQSPS
ncbi:hypothetical protein F5888DRAFT_1888844 [Russula emetica]|nr:hypothetical protein F5888DRAFT_1888844 [Russula emetica]